MIPGCTLVDGKILQMPAGIALGCLDYRPSAEFMEAVNESFPEESGVTGLIIHQMLRQVMDMAGVWNVDLDDPAWPAHLKHVYAGDFHETDLGLAAAGLGEAAHFLDPIISAFDAVFAFLVLASHAFRIDIVPADHHRDR